MGTSLIKKEKNSLSFSKMYENQIKGQLFHQRIKICKKIEQIYLFKLNSCAFFSTNQKCCMKITQTQVRRK